MLDAVLDAAPAVLALVGLRPRTISFCGAVKWWKWCRVKPPGRKCWLPWNC